MTGEFASRSVSGREAPFCRRAATDGSRGFQPVKTHGYWGAIKKWVLADGARETGIKCLESQYRSQK